MSRIGVLHVLDTLAIGGAERAAVNLLNEMPRDKYRLHLCTTRSDGPLRTEVSADAKILSLERRNRFDRAAVGRLVQFIRDEKIEILHAHGSALFVAVWASLSRPHPIVVWHAHYGRLALENRRAWAHRVALRRAGAVIAVSRQLAAWCASRLGFPSGKTFYIPNMACVSAVDLNVPSLPGVPGSRIVCVANIRDEKDHLSLVRAIGLVAPKCPAVHLLLVGADSFPQYSAAWKSLQELKLEIARNGIDGNVTFLGQRQDVPSLLRACDIGALSSKSEGLPVSLLEYGLAGLPVVSTRVGQCGEVLDDGRAGILVPSQSPTQLAEALLFLLESPERRASFGQRLLHRMQTIYSAAIVIKQITSVYDRVLASRQSNASCVEPIQNSVQA